MLRMNWWGVAWPILMNALIGFASVPRAADEVSGLITRTYMIVENTHLTGNVTCETGNTPCFVFGASDVELRLNGFSITGRADPVTACGGATFGGEIGVVTGARNNVAIRGPGLIQRFRMHGVQVIGSTNARIENVTMSSNCAAGIIIQGNAFGTLVEGNTSVRNGSTAPGLSCGGI